MARAVLLRPRLGRIGLGGGRRVVIRNTKQTPVKSGPNKGLVLPYLTAVVNGRSVPIAIDPERRTKRGDLLVDRMRELGAPEWAPPGMETVDYPAPAKRPPRMREKPE